MPLFKKNKKIGDQLEKSARTQHEKGLSEPEEDKPYVPPQPWSDMEIANYFIGVGIDCRGDLQTYMYEQGGAGTVELKVDLVALAAACAGCPLPETGLFAEVGVKIRIEKTNVTLLGAYMAPQRLDAGGRALGITKNVVFLAMKGYKFSAEVGVSMEVGVKTPDIPGIPKPTGGDWSNQKPEVEKGTYADLCAFECGAKASLKMGASIGGQRLYISDPAPTYIERHTGSSSGSTMEEIKTLLLSVLEHGDKKQVLKNDIFQFFDSHSSLAKYKPTQGFWKKHVTGGNVTASDLISSLEQARGDSLASPSDQFEIDALILNLRNFKAAALLEPYNFVSLWSVSPSAEATTQAYATASFKASVGVAGVGAEATATVTGPGVSVKGKDTFYRFQVAAQATPAGQGRPRSNAISGHKMNAQRTFVPSCFAITTQDTHIVYGQIDLSLLGVGVKVGVGAQQGLISTPSLQKEKEIGEPIEGRHGVVDGKLKGKIGLEEIGVEGSGSATWKYKLLNYMYYESAVASWAPPAQPGAKEGELADVVMAPGTGYQFGQSVEAKTCAKAVARTRTSGELDGYFQGLANCIGVVHSQMKEFVDEYGELMEDLAADPSLNLSAFLIEATFSRQSRIVVPAKWVSGRWMLGPFGLGKTLRGSIIPKQHAGEYLEAIRLRYRRADTTDKSRVRFSLGFKYIASGSLVIESIERAGSESIINVATRWYNRFARYNTGSDVQAYETAVPVCALLHQ
ncbi:MAG: hypothetical protein U0165_12210 [Polyangiaceae bacterium]